MKTKLLALLMTTALVGPALAQEPAAPAPATGTATEQPAPATPAPAAGDAAGFITEQEMDQWRASELIGTAVYGPDDASIGEINDVLVGRDGQVEVAIVGVGGFLGIGEKDVGIPFTTIEWRFEEPAAAATNPDGTPAAGGTAAPTAPAGNSGTMAPSGGAATTTEAPSAEDAASPDRAYVKLTREQLEQAPAFVDIDADENTANPAPAAGDAPAKTTP